MMGHHAAACGDRCRLGQTGWLTCTLARPSDGVLHFTITLKFLLTLQMQIQSLPVWLVVIIYDLFCFVLPLTIAYLCGTDMAA